MPEDIHALRNRLTELATRLVDLEEAARVARRQLEGIDLAMAEVRADLQNAIQAAVE